MKSPSTSIGIPIMVAVGFALLPLSTDLFLASLPGIRRYFDIGVSQAQLTLSVFIAGFAVSQLVYGPLSDRFGRRPVLVAGVFIYFAATLACMAATSIEWLIAARFVQAVGACSGAVIGRAIVRDLYGQTGSARMLSYITAGMSLGPIVGPVVGSYVEVSFGWRGNFAVLAAVGGTLLLGVALALRETNAAKDAFATAPRRLAANYGELLRHRAYVGYTLVVALTYSGIFSFVSGSSFVLIEVLGVPPRYFGFLFGGAVLGYITGNLVNGRLAVGLGVDRLLVIGTSVAVLGAGTMAALSAAGVQTVPAVVLPMFVFFLGTGFNMPCAMAGAIGPFPRIAGSASALLGFVQMVFGAVVGFAVGRFHDGTTGPMTFAVALCALGAAGSFWLIVRPSFTFRR